MAVVLKSFLCRDSSQLPWHYVARQEIQHDMNKTSDSEHDYTWRYVF